jgi:hypothetical protein
MTERAARGSLNGRWQARLRPNLQGVLTIEQALPAGRTLHLAGWTRRAGPGEFISLSATVATRSARSMGMRECTFNYYLEINRNTPSPYRSNVSRIILRTISTLKPFGRRQTSGLSVIFCRQSWNTSVKLR